MLTLGSIDHLLSSPHCHEMDINGGGYFFGSTTFLPEATFDPFRSLSRFALTRLFCSQNRAQSSITSDFSVLAITGGATNIELVRCALGTFTALSTQYSQRHLLRFHGRPVHLSLRESFPFLPPLSSNLIRFSDQSLRTRKLPFTPPCE